MYKEQHHKICTFAEILINMIKNHTGYFILALIIIFSSCTTHKQITYLQNVDSIPSGTVYYKQPLEYYIQNGDILYIRVMTLNEDINEMINTFSTRYSQNLFQNEISLFLYGYSVSDSGYVDVPSLGEVKVIGLTVEEAKEVIKQKVDESIRNATVIVKLISYKFSVVGEVHKPGVYKNYNNQLTILEAISMAGDITDYGNRHRVLVIRPTKTETKTFRVDLTDKSLLSSEAFFLIPNDMVYVEPIKSKTFRINIPTMALVLSTITTLILVLSFVSK